MPDTRRFVWEFGIGFVSALSSSDRTRIQQLGGRITCEFVGALPGVFAELPDQSVPALRA